MKKSFITIAVIFIFSVIFTVQIFAQNGAKQNQKTNKPLKILKLKQPIAPGCSSVSEIVEVKVTFDKSNKITYTEITKKSACDAFNESVLRVVRAIEFEPEIKDGRAISITKTLRFNRRMY